MAPEAMMARGNDYLFGRGVTKDYEQAVTRYRKAVEAGSTAAMTNLGFMYQNGYGVDKDDAQAVGWYRKAATAVMPLDEALTVLTSFGSCQFITNSFCNNCCCGLLRTTTSTLEESQRFQSLQN